MKNSKCILLAFLFLLAFSCSDNEPLDSGNDNPDSIDYFQALNISYGEDSDQVFDIYLPENRTLETKVMILVHGGGWSSGDKIDMNPIKDLFRQELSNVAIVNINYRLADENNPPYPMQINDISAVINFLKDNQSTYVISDEFGFIGTSAGAHLSLLWSYAFDEQDNINMVCSIVGPTNLTDPAYLDNTDVELQALLDLFGIETTTEFLEEVSPYHQVTATAPPTILFYGGQDPLIPITQGTAMRDRLDGLGVVNEFTLYPNESHGWVGLNLLDTWVKLKAFTQTYL